MAKDGLANLRKGVNNMATSSIFHNVRISDKKQVKAFVAALEAFEKEESVKPDRPFHTVNTDRELSYKLAEMRKKAREQR